MAVSIVDSSTALEALLDCLENIPTQPPSLYLDLEGVRLSRHGTISIMQICVLPRNQVFLVEIHVLQGKAFSIPNHSGTTLKSVLESEMVPKVFFDVRNDADALFAHFQVSIQGVHDIQLLEVATRSYSKERVAGLAKCIENDLHLAAEAKEAWKATKQRGHALFASEHGESYELFNVRPMLQEIIEYCTNDVVYLPLLWIVYTRKLSAEWATKVEEETCRRLLMSQAVLYDPHGKDKTLSPWASYMRYSKHDYSRNKGKVSMGSTENKRESAAERVAKNAAQRKAGKQPEARLTPPSSSSLGEIYSQRPMKKADLKVTEKISDVRKTSGDPPPLSNLPIRFRPASHQKTLTTEPSWSYPAALPLKWTCSICSREMERSQKQEHLDGKPHIARLKLAQNATPGALVQTATTKIKSPQATTATTKSPQKAKTKAKPKPKANSQKAKSQQPSPRQAKGILASSQSSVPTASASLQAPVLGSPDCGFIEFDQHGASRSFLHEEGSFRTNEDYGLEDFGCLEYGLCDKDCGWCGHCMDGADF